MPGRMQLQQSVLLALPGRFSTAPACDLAARPGDLALPLGQACRRRGVVGKCGLTIHSSRTRFAGRLNSGVRPLRFFCLSHIAASCGVSFSGSCLPQFRSRSLSAFGRISSLISRRARLRPRQQATDCLCQASCFPRHPGGAPGSFGFRLPSDSLRAVW
jgi:hypothetical protein